MSVGTIADTYLANQVRTKAKALARDCGKDVAERFIRTSVLTGYVTSETAEVLISELG